MTDEGYTLAETLAALTILGLALGGMGLVVSLIGRQQLAATRAHNAVMAGHAAQDALERLAGNQGPFTSGGRHTFTGQPRQLSFPCADSSCWARLEPTGKHQRLIVMGADGVVTATRLRQASAQFSYTDALGATDHWPRIHGGALRAIGLYGDNSSAPLAVARIWRQEPRDCQFDGVIKACREEAL